MFALQRRASIPAAAALALLIASPPTGSAEEPKDSVELLLQHNGDDPALIPPVEEDEPAVIEPQPAGAPVPIDQSTLDRMRQHVSTTPGAVAGEHGHDFTFGLACDLLRGFGKASIEEVMPVFKDWNAKLNLQLIPNNSATYFYTYGDKLKFGRYADAQHPPDATVNQSGPTHMYKLEDTHIFNQNFYLTGLYSHDWNTRTCRRLPQRRERHCCGE